MWYFNDGLCTRTDLPGQHSHFRRTWNELYRAASSGKRPAGMSLGQYLSMGVQFCHHLDMHHNIEETYFPVLAKKMPAFRRELELLTQHKHIHAGLVKLRDYIEACRSGERELRMDEIKAIMDSFGTVLWQHLDEEVKTLGAENMRRYWTVQEMSRIPFG